jgi:hypothetical protein
MNLKIIKNSEKINKSNNCEAETKKGAKNIRRRRNRKNKCKSNKHDENRQKIK